MLLRKMLIEGKASFGVHVGIISRIENEQYEVFAVDTDYGGIKQGDIYQLQDTYCRSVISNARTMVFDDVAEITEMLKHPRYLNTQLRAYIGTPLVVNDEIWGTLNFSSQKPRLPQFSHQDFHSIESLAREISDILSEQSTRVVTSRA